MVSILAQVLDLPADVQWHIYRSYFSQFVVPRIAVEYVGMTMKFLDDHAACSRSPLDKWVRPRSYLAQSLSKIGMFNTGKLDVTNICAVDREVIFAMLYQPQILMRCGRTYITTHASASSCTEPLREADARIFLTRQGAYKMRLVLRATGESFTMTVGYDVDLATQGAYDVQGFKRTDSEAKRVLHERQSMMKQAYARGGRRRK